MTTKKPANKKKSHTTLADSKLKVLSPTLREKKRFIRVQVESTKQFAFKELSESLLEEITLYMGIIDVGKAGVWFLRDKFNEEKQELIIKVGVKFKDKLLSSLALINNVGNQSIKLNTKRVSGTLKGVFKE